MTVLGTGDDFVFGTADDVDVDFGPDVFVPGEGFTGVEDTLNSVAFGLWSSENGGEGESQPADDCRRVIPPFSLIGSKWLARSRRSFRGTSPPCKRWNAAGLHIEESQRP